MESVGVFCLFVCLFSEKIYKLNEDMACSVAGTTPDAKVLTNSLLRGIYSSNRSQFHVRSCLQHCAITEAHAQFGGKCPVAVSLLCIGWGKHHGFQVC